VKREWWSGRRRIIMEDEWPEVRYQCRLGQVTIFFFFFFFLFGCGS